MRFVWIASLTAALIALPTLAAAKSKAAKEATSALEDALEEAKDDRDCKKAIAGDLEDLIESLEDDDSAKGMKRAKKALGSISDDAEDCPKAVRRALSEAESALDDDDDDDEEEDDRRRPDPADKPAPRRKPSWNEDPDAAEAACTARKAVACHALAQRYTSGDGVDKNESTAVEYYAKACDLKHMASCNEMGNIYWEGWGGVDADPDKSAGYYKKGCDGGHGDACRSLGSLHEQGKGAPKDDKKALALYEKSCKRSSGDGCYEVGKAHENGFAKLPTNLAKAIEFYEKACNLKSGDACFILAEMYRDGRGVKKSEGQEHTHYAAACSAGHQEGCKRTNVGKVLKEGVNQLTKGVEALQNLSF